jgi:vancomycin permeability regulator SanA
LIAITQPFPHNHQIIMSSGSLPSWQSRVNKPYIAPHALVKSARMLSLGRFLILITILVASFTLPRWLLNWRFETRIVTADEAPEKPTAIVYGAGLRRDGRPTTVLADRVQTAANLYQEGKVELLLMSGSSHGESYDESNSMREYAISLGVPEENILVDPEGDRTYLSCLRARDEFGVDEALLVSQRYHLPRALILCETLGIEAYGVASDLRTYRAQSFWSARESLATIRALWDAGSYTLGKVFSSLEPPSFNQS